MKRRTMKSQLSAGAMIVLGVACSSDMPTGSAGADQLHQVSHENKVLVCHGEIGSAHLIEVAFPALAAHLSQGDHIARFVVDKASNNIGDGVHFALIGEAVAAARAIRIARNEQETADCRITINVAAGTYRGTTGSSSDPDFEHFPVIVDVPDITLHGAFAMQLDGDNRATGISESGLSSTIVAIPPLTSVAMYSEPILAANGHVGGFKGNGLIVEGFTFKAGHEGVDAIIGGLAILSLRVVGLDVRNNRFDGGFSEAVDLRASSGHVDHNHISGGGGTCDICLAGPGDFYSAGNRLLAGGIPGILTVPAVLLPVPPLVEQQVLPATATVTASIVNNEVRDHQKIPVGVGIRVAAVGIGAPNVAGLSIVDVRNNTLVNNRFGMLIEAAFPFLNTLRRGDVNVTIADNTFSQSCQANLYVSLARHTTGLGLNTMPYLLNSNYTITLNGNVELADVWYSHPAGFGNSLTIDGNPIANGTVHSYNGAKVC